jgi:hypothetical protein
MPAPGPEEVESHIKLLIRYAISHILNNNHIIPDTYFLFLIK